MTALEPWFPALRVVWVRQPAATRYALAVWLRRGIVWKTVLVIPLWRKSANSQKEPSDAWAQPMVRCPRRDVVNKPYYVFGRDDSDDSIYAPWWPIWADEGPQFSESPEACLAGISERLGDDEPQWVELAAVPVPEWTTASRAGNSQAVPRP